LIKLSIKDLSIFERFSIGYLIILMVVITLGIYSTVKLGQLGHITRSINAVDNKLIEISNKLRDAILSQREFEKKYFILGDRDFYNQFKKIEAYVNECLAQITIYAAGTKELQDIEEISRTFKAYLSLVDAEAVWFQAGCKYPKTGYEQEKAALVNRISNHIGQVIRKTKKAINRKISVSEKIGVNASKVVAAATGLALVLSVLIAFINAQTISYPILLLINGIKEVAEGKFEKRIEIPSPPEIKKLAEEFNYMSLRLKQLDEIKSDIISHVSHELRTPLAIIKESVSLLASADKSSSSLERQYRLLDIIAEECERLIATVKRILDLSKMEAGKVCYQFVRASIGVLIGRSVSMITPACSKKNIDIDVQIDSDVPAVSIDIDKIYQVLNVLLENAVKFTPKNGHIVVRAFVHNPDQSASDNMTKHVVVSVSDDGCGIQQKHIKEIFYKFKTFDSRGTGLGLYIAKSIINVHGGRIWVESTEEKGSTFYFTIPVYV